MALEGTSPADTRGLRCSLVRAGRTWAASLDDPEPAARLEELISRRMQSSRPEDEQANEARGDF